MDSVLFLYLTGKGTDCVQGVEISHPEGNLAARIGILLLADKVIHCSLYLSRFFLAPRRMRAFSEYNPLPSRP